MEENDSKQMLGSLWLIKKRIVHGKDYQVIKPSKNVFKLNCGLINSSNYIE